MFKRKKYETYGECGLYEGVAKAATNKILGKEGCRIHVSQNDNQEIKIEIMEDKRVIKSLWVKGDKWIRVMGGGKYWVKVYNNMAKTLKAGISIREIKKS